MIPDSLRFAPPVSTPTVCPPGEFPFAATALEHGHIYDQCKGLVQAGGTLVKVYDPDPQKTELFRTKFPSVHLATSLQEILDDPAIRLVAAAAIPSERAELGCRVMRAGKDYFTDKAPFTTLEQIEQVRQVCRETGRKYTVYFNERTHVESAVYASQAIAAGAIGRVVNYIGTGPHRLNAASRPAWFWNKAQAGGILGDIGIHHVEQFTHFTGSAQIDIKSSSVANFTVLEHPDFEDVGEAHLLARDTGATGYFRIDWLNPKGLRTWGDGRVFLLGTSGYIELRKYIDAGRSSETDHVLLVNQDTEQLFCVAGQVGFPFFGELILDCLNRTELSMTQEYIFTVAALALQTQMQATRLR